MVKVPSNLLGSLVSSVRSERGYIGRDGWFFLGNDFDQEYDQALGLHTVDDSVVANWKLALCYATDVLERRSIKFVFLVTPAKWSVYRDKIRSKHTLNRPASSLLRLKEALDGSLVNLVDPTDALVAERVRGDTYSPLNSHWNNLGGMVGWTELSKGISRALPNVALPRLPPVSGIEVLDAFNEAADIAGIRGRNPWSRPVFANDLPVYDYILPGYERSPQRGEREVDLTELPVTTECAYSPNDLRVLVVRDSTGNQISPYIQTSFRTVLQHKHLFDGSNTYSNILGPAKLFCPDLIVYVLTERYLVYNFLDVEYWRAANEFDQAIDGYVWPKEQDRPYAEFYSSNCASPSALKMPFQTEPKARYLNLSIHSESNGRVRVWYVSNGEQHDMWFPIDSTHNQLFLEVPANHPTEIVYIQDVDDRSSSTVNRIEVRSAR